MKCNHTAKDCIKKIAIPDLYHFITSELYLILMLLIQEQIQNKKDILEALKGHPYIGKTQIGLIVKNDTASHTRCVAGFQKK